MPLIWPLSYYLNLPGVTNLECVSGSASPCHLIADVSGIPFYLPVLRINSFHYDDFKVRIGGHFHHMWNDYGTDSLGNTCSSEIGGLGITADKWAPNNYAYKSAGIRISTDNFGKDCLKGLG